jgi:5,10-methylenetetrahydromethanopterin reductase
VGAPRRSELRQGARQQFGDFEAQLRDASSWVPIYVAASGPRMLRTAGAVADGVIITLGDNDRKLQLVADGAGRERRHEPPPVFVYTGCTVTDDIESTARLLKAALHPDRPTDDVRDVDGRS